MAALPTDTITIVAMRDHSEQFKFLYGAGWLIETSPKGAQRKGLLSEVDQNWMSENIQVLGHQKAID